MEALEEIRRLPATTGRKNAVSRATVHGAGPTSVARGT
jgi:hypothetical protein